MTKDNKKIAKTRRQRGYHWEDTIVKRFNSHDDWNSVRLGSTSNALPDVMAVNNIYNTVIAIEAKSGTTYDLRVPFDQIERCIAWVSRFKVYDNRKVVLAFKFSQKKRVGTDIYENRQLREFFKVWNIGDKVTDCVCNYEGDFFTFDENKKRQRKSLNDFEVISKKRRDENNFN